MSRAALLWVAVFSATCLLALMPAAQAGVTRDDRSAELYLDLAGQPQYAAVGRFSICANSGMQYSGSGTLISSDWVLTAAHCVDQVSSMTFSVGGVSYKARQWIANPNWNGNLARGYDLGLVQLDMPITGITPAFRYTGSRELGATGTIVGYGMTGTGLTGATQAAGTKRAGQNAIDLACAGARILMIDFDNPYNGRDSTMGSASPLDLEYLVAPGDSGGGLFITDGTGTYLAGVTSFLQAPDGSVNFDYGDLGGFGRVSVFNGWIDAVIGSAAASGNTRGLGAADEPMGTTPEPATLGLLGLGLAALAARRGTLPRG